MDDWLFAVHCGVVYDPETVADHLFDFLAGGQQTQPIKCPTDQKRLLAIGILLMQILLEYLKGREFGALVDQAQRGRAVELAPEVCVADPLQVLLVFYEGVVLGVGLQQGYAQDCRRVGQRVFGLDCFQPG